MACKLDSREYKLLLDPKQFSRTLTTDQANDFLYGIRDKLKLHGELVSRLRSQFSQPEVRKIQFWDLPNCALTANDFALRSRVENEKRKTTLKLRKADYFIVKSYYPKDEDWYDDVKFEEDIAPLEVKPKGADSSIVFPTEHSIRSRFSLSLTTKKEINESTTTEDIFDWYPLLNDGLDVPVPPGRTLIGGRVINESVAKGAEIDFSDGVEGKLALTIWSFTKPGVTLGNAQDEQNGAPEIAEISFTCKTTDDGDMSAKAAREAYDFFIALQTHLNVNMSDASKTSLALPDRCAHY